MTRSERLAEQLDWHWRANLRPRLEGLTDEEYLWEPVPGCWSIRPRGTSTAPMSGGSGEWTIDFASPEPEPAPVTTIAWRLAHVIVSCLGYRVAWYFGGPEVDFRTFAYPRGPADEALQQLDETYKKWNAGGPRALRTLTSIDRSGQRRGPTRFRWKVSSCTSTRS